MAITIIGRIVYLLFRLTFVSSSAPVIFYVTSEMVVGSSQDLLEDDTWNLDTPSSIWN